MAGIAAAVMVNWILWPFIARHELRKALSTKLQHLAILYRSVVARYIYYLEDNPPTSKDIERSEMLEGRLREAFIRDRQLLALTRHELVCLPSYMPYEYADSFLTQRLRAPFDPTPYTMLLSTLESFFEDLVKVRQYSLYFQPRMHEINMTNPEGQLMNQILLPYRRDAVASILMNLYMLAGALKTGRPVPRYMPSARVARKRLLESMAGLEAEADVGTESHDKNDYGAQQSEGRNDGQNLRLRKTFSNGRRWGNVYQYAFNGALTDIVDKLEELERITVHITGEMWFDLDRPDE